MSGTVKHRALAAFVGVALLIGLLVVSAGPVVGEDRPAPYSGPCLIYYDGGLDAAGLHDRLGITVTEDYGGFAMADLTPAQRQGLESEAITVEPLEDLPWIYLRSYEFDTRLGEPLLPIYLMSRPIGEGWYLVQFKGPIKDEWRAQLANVGEVVGYYANFTSLVYLSASARDIVPTWPFVRWIGPYHPGYRLDPGVQDGRFALTFFPGRGGPEGIADLQLHTGLTVVSYDGDEAIVEGTLEWQVYEAVNMPEVHYMEQYVAPALCNSVARTIIKADVAHNHGLNGRPSNQVVAVTDTGIYRAHGCFSETGKIAAFIDLAGDGGLLGGDGHGHGTHVAGSVLGDAPVGSVYLTYNAYDGQAFGARAVAVKAFNNAGLWAGGPNYYAVWDLPYGYNARVNNNSWAASTHGAYSVSDRNADQITWDHRDYVLVNAAGNLGESGPGTLGSPACAKNVIAVGATERSAPENVAAFSSRGPAQGSRIKPDVMAPGVLIRSAYSGTVNGYTSASGTSRAAAQVSGAAALVREYFMKGYYPTGTAVPAQAFTPNAALVKAVLINGGKEMTGTGSDRNGEVRWPNSSQGWGRIDLDRSLYFAGDARKLVVWNDPATLGTGQGWVGTFNVADGAQEAKVTLAWTDAPAPGGSARPLVNDLDLRVTAPNGEVFRGNNFANLNPGYSVTGGRVNRRDTVEGVHLLPNYSLPGNLPTGTYTITVTASNVPQPASNFAVVVSGNGVSQTPPAPTESIAVMGDHRGTIRNLLQSRGYTVRNYAAGDYSAVIANLATHDVVILNHVANTAGFDQLCAAADSQPTPKGLIFCGSWPVAESGMGVLTARQGDPATTSGLWSQVPVKTTVLVAHPIFSGYGLGQQITLIDGGGRDYQTYDGYSGDNLGASAMWPGGTFMIGARDRSETGSARHVILGSLGASFYTNPEDWTPDGQQVLANAVEWAGGAAANPPKCRVALMGDYYSQIKQYLTGAGYRVTQFGPGDYSAVIAGLADFDVVLLHRVDNASGFNDLLTAAQAMGRGLVFMNSYPTSSHAVGVLVARRADPHLTENFYLYGPVRLYVSAEHPVVAGYSLNMPVTILNGGDNDFQTYAWYSGLNVGLTLMPVTRIPMLGVKDRPQPGGAREVLLGTLGACDWTNISAWTPNAKEILKNAIEWAKYVAP